MTVEAFAQRYLSATIAFERRAEEALRPLFVFRLRSVLAHRALELFYPWQFVIPPDVPSGE